MPHTARTHGESGFYHVVAKGDGGQVIFEGNADREKYVALMEEMLEGRDLAVHAYCLMSNHVHLLLRDDKHELSAYMKTLSETYAMYFRWRTGRNGHVFKRPFWSEPVENDAYYLLALRYIHANPEPAGICTAKDYPWSSYQSFVRGGSFVETSMALGMFGGVEQFEDFHRSGKGQALPFPKSALRGHLSPDELVNVALDLLGREALNGLRQMKPVERAPFIAVLAEAGFTEQEISRVSGLGKSAIHRAIVGARVNKTEPKGSIPFGSG